MDLTTAPTPYFDGSLKLAGHSLCDRSHYEFTAVGGTNGMGLDPSGKRCRSWGVVLQISLFQDPVQPGSLGMEAMIQVLQWYVVDQGLGKG